MPIQFDTLSPDVGDKPPSTVSAPTPSPLDADAQKQLQATIEKVGYAPRTQEEMNMFHRMAFSPEQLKQYGLDKSYQTLAGQTASAQQSLAATPPPTNSGLRVLQDALNAKSTVTNQQLGESELFKQAGISGYAVLRQSLSQRQREMGQKYDSFKTTVMDTASGMQDVYNLALSRYEVLRDEMDKQDQRMYGLLDEALEYERMMDKMYKEQQLDMEFAAYKTELENKYSSSTTGGVGNSAAVGDYNEVSIAGQKIASPELGDIFGLGEEKGWCGVWSSTLSTATKVGDSWASKKSHIDKTANPSSGDKLLIPLGVTDGKGYGHVATVLSYNPNSGDILVVESNRDGRQNRGEGPGVATMGVYNLADLQGKYGSNFGFASGELRDQYQGAIPIAEQIIGKKALTKGVEMGLFHPEGSKEGDPFDVYKPVTSAYGFDEPSALVGATADVITDSLRKMINKNVGDKPTYQDIVNQVNALGDSQKPKWTAAQKNEQVKQLMAEYGIPSAKEMGEEKEESALDKFLSS
jgi:hypothetical protein